MARKKKKKLKLKKGPFIILLLLLISILSLSTFYWYTHTSKYLFLKGLDKSYDILIEDYDSFMNKYLPYIDNNYYNNTDTSISIKTAELNQNVNLKGNIYLNNSDYYYDLDINNNNKQYDFEMLTNENNLYYKIDKSNYYFTPLLKNNFSYNDAYKKLISILNNSIKENVKSSLLSKENEKIDIDSKSFNTKKITFNINTDDYYKIMKTFYEKIKNEENILNYLLTTGNYSDKNSLIDYINSNIDLYQYKLKNKSNNKTVCKYSIYLYKSEPLKTEIDFSLDVSYQMSYIKHDDYLEINYTEENDKSSYIKVSNNKIDMFINGFGYGEGSYTNNSIDIQFNDYNKQSLGYLKYSIIDKYTTDIDFNIALDSFNLTIKSNNKIEVDKSIPNFDIANSSSAEKMTQDDKNKLIEVLTLLNNIFIF